VLLSINARGGEASSPSVEHFFVDLAFRPHFPSEQQLVSKYGEGVVTTENGTRYRNYYLPNGNRWFRFRVDLDNQVDKPVTEVLLSTVPLASESRTPAHEIGMAKIRGIELGDPAAKARATFGVPLREYLANLGANKQLTVLEYFPKTLDLGSCIRFYIKRGAIVAFSFSSEE